MKALILAAGEGTRMRPLTLDKPKPMLPVAGIPLLEHILLWLRKHGVDQVAINLNYRPEAITGYLGDGSRWGVEITYSYEDPILGTAGAAKKLEDYFEDGPFVIVYGDVLTDMDLMRLLRFHHDREAAATMAARNRRLMPAGAGPVYRRRPVRRAGSRGHRRAPGRGCAPCS